MSKLKARKEKQEGKSVIIIEREKDGKEKQADLEARLAALEACVGSKGGGFGKACC